MKDYTDSPILITGAARSGTSMVGGTIHLCGAWKGDTGGPQRHNAKGMFENLALRQKLIKPYLTSINCDKLGQYPLPDTDRLVIPNDFRQKVLNEIKSQGWNRRKPWMYKCAKMSLVWPLWKHAFPDSKWVIVRRKTPDIIRSCIRTGFMKAYSRVAIQHRVGAKNEYEGWLYWVKKHEEKFIEIIQSGVNAKVVWPERMVNCDYQQMMETVEWLGLEWNAKAVMDFIEPKLWKARQYRKR